MPRRMEHGDRIGVRLTPEARRLLEQAAASLGLSKSQLVRYVILQALRHQQIAVAAVEDAAHYEQRPAYPEFVSSAVS
jgi:uncharacterized protein (DUF1778 family)